MKKSWLLILFASVTILFTGCQNNVPTNDSDQVSNKENTILTTNTFSEENSATSPESQSDTLTALQVLGDISCEQAEIMIRYDNSDSKKVNLTIPNQLEQLKELLNQIKIKQHSVYAEKEKDPIILGEQKNDIFYSKNQSETENDMILLGEPCRTILINNDIKLYTDGRMNFIYINSQPYDLLDFPREFFDQMMETKP